jgi:hypothetical protein
MSHTFHLLDLPSQALAILHLLSSLPEKEKLSWLGAHGSPAPVEMRVPGARLGYHYESVLGLRCAFFIDGMSSCCSAITRAIPSAAEGYMRPWVASGTGERTCPMGRHAEPT